MDRYPSALAPTRDTAPRRIAEVVGAAGLSSILALALSTSPVQPAFWWIAGGLTGLAAVVVICDEVRLFRFDAHAWSTDQWHLLRENEYRRRQGIFLTHGAEPTTSPDGDDGRPWWTVSVQLVQHRDGPLSAGTVKEVEYSFGRNFTEGPVKVQSPQDDFRYETDLHGPLLLLARVVFKNRWKRPLIVERYINLPE
ncbi:hypothetical protein GCM10009809_38230 [Isoptericola hypogeus]|uniref:SMODS-associating 2TM beta-strand rich effector domain-containing protein n=1 Tax=Isoptericola hypogeus TaxID=300179 RepID=A0ABN2JU62_9MICO